MRDIETIKQQCGVASQHVFVLPRLYLGLQLHSGTKWRERKVFMYKILSYFIVCFMRGSHRLQRGGWGQFPTKIYGASDTGGDDKWASR